MSEEQRIIKDKTFNNTAVRGLTKTQARFLLLCQLKRLEACKAEMSDYDLLRLDNYTSEYYRLLSSPLLRFLGHKAFMRSWKTSFFVCILFIVLMLLPFALLAEGTSSIIYDKIMDMFDQAVIETHDYALHNVWDVNKDNKIDCMDYSICFKLAWDDKFPNWKDRCDLVRNYNAAKKFNHLFVSLYTFNNNIILIEPQSKIFPYRLEDFWGDRYDSKYNHLFERDIWMKEIK